MSEEIFKFWLDNAIEREIICKIDGRLRFSSKFIISIKKHTAILVELDERLSYECMLVGSLIKFLDGISEHELTGLASIVLSMHDLNMEALYRRTGVV